MDILSFILGLQKGKSMGGGNSSGGTIEWVGASGEFVPTSASHIINHNLGIVPDIFIIYYNQAEKIPGSSTQMLTAMGISKKLLGEDKVNLGAGYGLGYNPSTDIQMVFGLSGGLESQSSSNSLASISDATAQKITVGSSMFQLVTDRGKYKWSAFAMK